MTLPEFAILEKQEQINLIKSRGTFLFIRQEAGIDIVLYQIGGFYAEVYFEAYNKKNMRIRSFDDTALLDVYLKQVNISELKQLLWAVDFWSKNRLILILQYVSSFLPPEGQIVYDQDNQL